MRYGAQVSRCGISVGVVEAGVACGVPTMVRTMSGAFLFDGAGGAASTEACANSVSGMTGISDTITDEVLVVEHSPRTPQVYQYHDTPHQSAKSTNSSASDCSRERVLKIRGAGIYIFY